MQLQGSDRARNIQLVGLLQDNSSVITQALFKGHALTIQLGNFQADFMFS
jgi:hypothetical protein